ncbi:hypothetical protein F511_47057 [Dorcoceras hygrometricum]|uniref:Uncharacterized protein n=1 Tax=Dorcoceras hygrometricum TaxID=472368 RepID=A0A2Z6ZYE2_9LAMI|nr:hypothetical protein F511_47057 [Dorcoceras hygrometricum]
MIGMNRMFIRWTRARWAGPSLSLVYLIRLKALIMTLTLNLKLSAAPLPFSQAAAAVLATPPPSPPLVGICSSQLFEEFPSVLISSGLLVQADEGVSLLVVDLIDESTAAYREEPVFL